MVEGALLLVVVTSVAMSALLTWSVRRTWNAVDTLSTMASRNAAAAEALAAQATLLAAQGQATTAHAALLSGSVDTLRRDLEAADYLEDKPEVDRWR
jgi:hypothetical protein